MAREMKDAKNIIEIKLHMDGDAVSVGIEIRTPVMRMKENQERMEKVHKQIREIGQEINNIVKNDIETTLSNIVDQAVKDSGKDMARFEDALNNLMNAFKESNNNQH